MAISQLFCSTGPPHKRDSLWSWLVCACAAVTWISALGFVFSFGVFLPVFMDYFNASREITGEKLWRAFNSFKPTRFHTHYCVELYTGCNE